MNDRFKFRFWDKDCEKYVSNERQRLNGLSLYMNNPQSFVTEQCTGLKDKNDQLIYEGDILNSLYKNDGCRGLYVVVWSNGCLCVRKFGNHQQAFVSISLNDLTRCEVIGNIHENMELVK